MDQFFISKSFLMIIIGFTSLLVIVVDAEGCSLCGGDNKKPRAPSEFRIEVEEGKRLTCQEIDAQAQGLNVDQDSQECRAFTQDTGYSTMCRCNPLENACPICHDNGVVDDDSRHPLGLGTVACDDIYARLSNVTKQSIEECSNLQKQALDACGCLHAPPLLQNRCTLCADGSSNFDIRAVSDDGSMCHSLFSKANQLDADSHECFALRQDGIRHCGCQAQLSSCSVCADGTEPPFLQQEQEEPPLSLVSRSSDGTLRLTDGQLQQTTCRSIQNSVAPDSPLCPKIQAMGYFLCGCKSPPVVPGGACTLCAGSNNDTTLPKPQLDNIFGSKQDDDDDDYHCRDAAIDIYATPQSSQTCLTSQAKAVLHCACPTLPPPVEHPTCTLCPSGAPPVLASQTMAWHNNMTCETYAKLVPHLYDGASCNMANDERDYCGCPDTVKCSLCRRGEDLVDPDRIVNGTFGKFTCRNLELGAQYIQVTKQQQQSDGRDRFEDTCIRFRSQYAPQCCPSRQIANLFVGDEEEDQTEQRTTAEENSRMEDEDGEDFEISFVDVSLNSALENDRQQQQSSSTTGQIPPSSGATSCWTGGWLLLLVIGMCNM